MGALRLRLAAVAGLAVAVLVLGYAVAQERPAAQAGGAAVQPAAEQAVPTADVVIVWCGGMPDAPPLPGLEAGAVDAVTQATPENGNIEEVAGLLAKELQAAGLTTLVIAADECRDPRTIVQAKAMVLGCPTYFSLPPWQMMRFLDDTLYRIRQARVRLNGHVATSFSTTDACVNVLQRMAGVVGGTVVDGAVISARRTSPEQRTAAIKELAGRIVAGLKPQAAAKPATE
jgi:flavodoxin